MAGRQLMKRQKTSPTSSSEAPAFHPSLHSRLESLSGEVFNMILAELVGTHHTHHYSLSYNSRAIMGLHPEIIRTSRTIHQLARSYLHLENKWIIFDVDFWAPFVAFIKPLIPALIVENDDDLADIPEGIMYVQLRLPLNLPTGVSRSGKILIPEDRLNEMLHVLQCFMFHMCSRYIHGSYMLRFLHGSVTGFTARRGYEGLRIRLYIQPKLATQKERCREILDGFRMLHGPLNELSIIGYADEGYALEVERSIAAPRTKIADRPIWDVAILSLWFLRKARRVSEEGGNMRSVSAVLDRVWNLYEHWERNDGTLWPVRHMLQHNLSSVDPIPAFAITAPKLYQCIADMHSKYRTLGGFIVPTRRYDSDDIKAVYQLGDLASGHLIHILFGLDMIFYRGDANMKPNEIHLSIYAMKDDADYIRRSEQAIQPHYDNLTNQTRELCLQAKEMACTVLDLLRKVKGTSPHAVESVTNAISVVESFRPWFCAHLRDVRWRFHGSLLPQGRLGERIAEFVVKEEDVPVEVRNTWVTLNMNGADPDGSGYYFM
ncbi:hypothetical protein P280DRAFT_503339 [Massarina eburnea CBS 473.64]|uniref:Uncharacterized protein n=1 Tax=Massarina eburnea CBS 473.64 TaxID=1395130 RepID=A0A6A6SKZ4_9PLEO|nr:hypothetical protein P280DRAFT_503339 [Massarina eburnea CBS 473.64]